MPISDITCAKFEHMCDNGMCINTNTKAAVSFSPTFCFSVKSNILQVCINLKGNKKVLLRECKRHTDRRVASPGGGVDRQTDGWTDMCENITFPYPSDAVGN